MFTGGFVGCGGWIRIAVKCIGIRRRPSLILFVAPHFVATTDSNHDEPVFPDRSREREVDGPNLLWVADLTYIATHRVSQKTSPFGTVGSSTSRSNNDQRIARFPDRSRRTGDTMQTVVNRLDERCIVC